MGRAAVAERPVPRETIPTSAPARLEQLPLDLVDVAENVRVDPGELEELAASIRELGVLQPIRAVGPGPDGRYRAVWGQRRILASRLAELATIPALVEAAADVGQVGARRSIEQLAENLQRKDLNPIEEANALAAVLEAEKGLTQAALATKLGRSAPWVANALRLRKLAPDVQTKVAAGEISAAHGKALASLPETDQVDLANRGLSAHDLEYYIKSRAERAGEEARKRKASEDASKRAVAALEEAALPKDAVLYLSSPWQISDDVVAEAMRAAGWTNVDARSWGFDRSKDCDCSAMRLVIQDGKGSRLEPVCASQAHWEAARKVSDAERAEKQRVEEAQLKRLETAVRASLEAQPPHPTVVRLLIREIDGYSGKNWSEYAKLDDRAALRLLAERLRMRAGTAYGKPVPIPSVLKALGVADDPAPAAAAKHPRRRPPAGQTSAEVLAEDDALLGAGS